MDDSNGPLAIHQQALDTSHPASSCEQGLVGTLIAVSGRALSSSATTSMKVPPTSTPNPVPGVADCDNQAMSAAEIDDYLRALDEPKRSTLTRLREAILEVLPDAEQGIAYGAPAFKVGGRVIAGFAAFKNHLSYLPHSGSVLPELEAELEGYAFSSGALRFPVDTLLPRELVRRLIEIRMRQAAAN